MKSSGSTSLKSSLGKMFKLGGKKVELAHWIHGSERASTTQMTDLAHCARISFLDAFRGAMDCHDCKHGVDPMRKVIYNSSDFVAVPQYKNFDVNSFFSCGHRTLSYFGFEALTCKRGWNQDWLWCHCECRTSHQKKFPDLCVPQIFTL